MTSIAAFPLTLVSLSKGTYAISLHGSNKAYLEPIHFNKNILRDLYILKNRNNVQTK